MLFRSNAAQQLQKSAKPAQLKFLDQQLAAETDSDVRSALSLALANLQLVDPDPAVRLAAVRMTDAEIEELRQVLHTHERDAAFQAGVGYYQQEGDFDFHYRIIQGAGNRTLTQMLCGELYQLVRMYRIQFSATPNRPRQAFAEHHRILDAIADRDGELAELLMRRHIGASKRNIARHFPDGAPQSRGES